MKKLMMLLAACLCCAAGYAQDYLGFINSNYSGITGAQLNPANIADSRFRVDVTLTGFNLNAANNYIGLQRSAFDHEGTIISAIRRAMKGDPDAFPAFRDPNFQSNYMVESINGKDKALYSSVRVALPSFMVTLNGRNAIGLSISARTYAMADGIGEQLARLVYADMGRTEGFDVSQFLNIDLKNEYMSANAMSWIEYGLTYAHVFRDKDEHFFKAGVTPKLLQGLASAYANVRDLALSFHLDSFDIRDDEFKVLATTDVNYGHSENLEFPSATAPDQSINPFVGDPTFYTTLGNGLPKFTYPGWGIDLGAVYEWRPRYMDHKFDMDGKTDLWRRDKNKYKLRIGLSILDIGAIKFPKGALSNDFRIDVKPIKYRQLDFQNYPVYDFDRIIDSLTEFRESPPEYRMSLPASISMQVDWNVYGDFYLNITPFYAFQQRNRDAKVHEMTVISLAPRWDHKWFGLSVPVSYNDFYARAGQPFKFGVMLRLGPLVLGSNDIASYTQGNFYGANLYMLLKVPIPYNRIRDNDKDGISNKKDLCRDIAGVWEFRGCPDRDNDHVQDKDDACPDVAGLKELKGCPDKDGDGITDAEDFCPDSAGTIEFRGCPDRDNDRVIDREDKCPDVPGLFEFEGCPDTDGDGVQDSEDACPDIFGPKEYKGCPDKDGDRVLDKEDDCPEIAGPAENKGCPWPDTDKDGIVDREDSCVTVPGLAQFKGCPPPPPPMKAAEKKIIERAFANLEFETSKDVIKPKSFSSLNALAGLLKNHQADWKLKLSGHTDNVGSAEKNMILSEKRAKAVKNYLVKKGVDPDQIITEWFGQERPIADNSTAKGRQKNRRVEMSILSKE